MKLYRNAEGVWVGTQAEAKNKNAIEVPTDKPRLLEWLNGNCRSSQRHGSDDDDHDGAAGDNSGVAAVSKSPIVDYERLVAGMTADAMADWIATAPTGKVADLMVALADRIQKP